MRKKCCLFSLLGLMMLLSGCFEEPNDGAAEGGMANLTLKVSLFEMAPFAEGTRAASAPEAYATRLNYAFFAGTEKVKNIAQQVGDTDFGILKVAIDKGTYTLVVVAHSQPSSPTISSSDNVQFKNPMTDAFCYCGEITVADEAQTKEITLERVVAKIEFQCQDSIPANVTTMQFKYTGGSLRLDPTTGYGSANSQQNASFTIGEEMTGQPATFDLYTIPREEDGRLTKLTITAKDANNATVAERVFNNVPIAPGQRTIYRGSFFTDIDDGRISIKVEGDWKKTRIFEF